jgi:lipopolysaccharide transport system ATP-binding protein
VQHGEIVGIVGRNGAGKSTLLRILSRITEPTSGYAEIHGRVGSLLEVGTGFHPELTGRENVYLNGVILGMRRAEISRKFDEIVAFAEVDKFIDTPVKHYSSGMQLRLAFSVAAHLEPEVLVVDEVLAVGDASFQRKCTGKMGDIAREGRTILFVSHNLAAVRQLCSSAVLLQSGQVVLRGTTAEVLRQYLASAFEDCGADLTAIRDRKGKGDLRFSYIRFEDDRGQVTSGLDSGRPGRIVLGVSGQKPLRNIQCCVTVRDELSQRILYLKSTYVDADLPQLAPGQELVCDIPRVHLGPGQYRLEIWMSAGTVMQDHLSDTGSLLVTDGNFFGTGQSVVPGFQVALMDFSWQIRDPRYEKRSSPPDGAFPEWAPSGGGASAVESGSPEVLRLSAG